MTPSKPMRFSIPLSPYGRFKSVAEIGEVAKLAEELGFFGIALPEHIVMPQKDGPPVRSIWYDNFVLGSHLATLTKRLHIVFTVLVVPYRPPIQTAKLIATLDTVAQGRLVCGVGAGWLKGEFRTLGVPFEERGAITDEYLRAMHVLWTQDTPSFKGEYVNFSNIAHEPRCYQKPHVPLWVGGSGPRVMRRVVEMGNGWIPMSGALAEIGADIASLKKALHAAGRDPATVDYSYSIIFGERDEKSERTRTHPTGGRTTMRPSYVSPFEAITGIGGHQTVGLNHLLLSFNWRTAEELAAFMRNFARDVLPAFSR